LGGIAKESRIQLSVKKANRFWFLQVLEKPGKIQA